MKKRCLITVLPLIFLLAGQNCHGAAKIWQIDEVHSNFYFTVDHIFSKVRGRFSDFSGTFNFDQANLDESSMKFVIRIESITTDVAKRDKHLQSEDFFDAEQYPEMTFESVSIQKTGKDTFEVPGKFTIKGKTYDLVLPLTFAGIKEHPAQKGVEVAGFNGTLILDRLAFGVGTGKFSDVGLVGKDVEVLVTLEVLSK